MVFDDTVDMKAVLSRIAAFFRDESWAVRPCRIGTVRQEEWLHRLIGHHLLGSLQDELALRADIARSCATRRSVVWGKPPPVPSNRPSPSLNISPQRRHHERGRARSHRS